MKSKIINSFNRLGAWIQKNRRFVLISFGAIVAAIGITLALLWYFGHVNRVIKAPADSTFLYTASDPAHKFAAFIGDKETNLPKVKANFGRSSVEFMVAGMPPKLAKPSRFGNKITFKDVQPDTDLTYETLSNGVKENFILKKQREDNRFNFFLKTNGAYPKKIQATSFGTTFYGPQNEYLFHLAKPYAVDAKGARTDLAHFLIQSTDDPAIYEIGLFINNDWLQDPARKYPVKVDPTIVYDTSALFSAGQFNRVKDTGSATPNLETYFQETISDPATLGLWHMDETADNTCSVTQDACDASGNGRHLTSTGTTINTATPRAGAAARTFNGTNQYLNTGYDWSKTATGQPFTLAAWINVSSFSDYRPIFGKSDANYEFNFEVTTAGVVYFMYYAGGSHGTVVNGVANAATGPFNIGTNTWHHVAVSYDGTYGHVYVDGLPGATFYSTGTWQNRANNLMIGYSGYETYTGLAKYFAGSIDDVLVSDRVYTAEEIKLMASRRPYSVYTSDIIDFASNTSGWNPLTWSELGVATGDGETLKDSTDLIAQWNFNETSGTTANNDAEGLSCGGTPANCDGTLAAGFASTGSQDAAVMSGWTANNKRWGAGGLMFDGTNDYLTVTNTAALNPSTISIEMWLKGTSADERIVHKYNTASPYQGYGVRSTAAGAASCYVGGSAWTDGIKPINDNAWHHIVCTYDGTNVRIYADGKLEKTQTQTGTLTYATNLYIGAYNNGASNFYKGTLDSLRIYSRVLTAAEILSNYNAANLEVQTRVGDTTTPDDGTWEAWQPIGNESVVAAMNTDAGNWSWDSSATYMPQTKTDDSTIKAEGSTGSLKLTTGILQSDANTVGLWHLDETGGADAYLKDSSGNNHHGTPTGTTLVNGTVKKARSFNGTSDYIDVGDSDAWDFGSGDFTLEAWVKKSSIGTVDMIISKDDDEATSRQFLFNINTTNTVQLVYFTTNTTYVYLATTATITDTNWHYLVGQRQGNRFNIFIDGILSATGVGTGTHGAIQATATNLLIGKRYYAANEDHFAGSIDEVRISNVARTQEEIAETYRLGRDHYLTRTIASTDLSGKTSLPFYIASDRPGTQLDVTVGDSAFANYQPDANTVALLHLEEAQTGDWSDTFSGASLNTGKWVEIDANTKISVNNGLVLSTGTTSAWDSGIISNQAFYNVAGNTLYANVTTGSTVATPNHMMIGWAQNQITSASHTVVSHAFYFNGGAFYVYQDGSQIGGPYGSGYAANTTYEIKITINSGGTATYQVKGGAYTNWTTLLAADTAKTALNMRAQVAQYQHTGTINEIKVTSPAVKDVSGNNNHGSMIGGAVTNGKFGKARFVGGSGGHVNLGSPTSLDFGNNGPFTFAGWIKPNVLVDYAAFVGKDIVPRTSPYSYMTVFMANGRLSIYNNTAWTDICPAGSVANSKWYHVAFVYNGTTIYGYVNGILCGSAAFAYTDVPAYEVNIGSWYGGSTIYDYNGILDEISISNIARTADEIRQQYEVGKRSHQVTIDFGAKLDSDGLIADADDLGFIVDATYYGLPSQGSQLFKGDKIIVRENYDGTEYLAQGTVTAITTATGAVTVASWDSGSTFPSGGYTANADVFKWQREYFDLTGSLSTQRNGVVQIALRPTDNTKAHTFWLDDFRSAGSYLTDPAGSTIDSSTGNRYFQFRVINSSSDYNVSSSLTSMTSDFQTLAPNPPTISTPEALSNTVIRWNFTDNASNESGTKAYDTSGTVVATNSAENVTYVDEGGLAPNTQYTRKVAAYNANGNSLYSTTVSKYTLAGVPVAPTVSGRTATTVEINPNPEASESATTTFAIYKEEGITCDGSGGSYIAANGSDNGATAVWQTDSTWSTVTATGLSALKSYVFCVKAKNAEDAETAFSEVGAHNVGYIPLSGDYIYTSDTANTSSFVTRYVDGNDAGRYVLGVDNGGDPNTAVFEIKSGALTINANDTLVVGKLTLTGGSAIVADGGQIKIGDPLCAIDQDADGYSPLLKLYWNNLPANCRRKNLLTTLAEDDCDDTNANAHALSATGGTKTTSGSDTLHTFYSSGSFVINCPVTGASVLVVAGGGAGQTGVANSISGRGGGGGQVISLSSQSFTANTYPVTVGAAGATSSFNGSTGAAGVAGASGGTSGSGNAGGAYVLSGGGGGGGQAAAGQNSYFDAGANGVHGGAGGSGVALSISGSSVCYGGGGGGGGAGYNGENGFGYGGAGGCAGAGAGGSINNWEAPPSPENGQPASAYVGGGGGGGSHGYTRIGIGGAGGSGIVIIRYPTSQ